MEEGEVVKQEVMFYPTKFRFPLWARRNSVSVRMALRNLSFEFDTVETVRPEFKLPVRLLTPFLDPRLPRAINPLDYMETVKSESPVDGSEVVEWMQYAHANKLALSARALEYNRAGSQLVYDSGDGYIPGVSLEDVRFKKQSASIVRRQGYALVVTPYGEYRIPFGGKNVGIYRDLITAGSVTRVYSRIQWVANLLKWRELATTPIRDPIGFFRDDQGNVIPNFFEQVTSRPMLRAVSLITLTSNREQDVTFAVRDPHDYTRVLATQTLSIPEGTSTIKFRVLSVPFVPPLVMQISPEDKTNTVLESYVVR